MAQIDDIIALSSIRAELRKAWRESKPGHADRIEQGGFIVRDGGSLKIVRWPEGEGASIVVPAHPQCKFDGLDIVASFHTHPNTGAEYLQEPSETDRRAVRDDPDLKARFYEGELVVARPKVYLITMQGTVLELGEARDILQLT